MSKPATMMWTPDGPIQLGGPKAQRVELSAGLIEWLAQFDAFARHFGLGLHCSHCQADLVGKNGSNDKVFAVACKCREFVGPNRDHRAQPQPLYDT